MDVYQRRRLVALSAIAVLFVFFVLLIRGCGDDEEPTTAEPLAGATGTGTSTTQTLAAYIDQADSICLQTNAAIADIDTADTEQAAIDEARAVQGELEQIQTLPPAAEGTDDVDKFLRALQDQATLLSDRVTASERGDTTAVAELDPQIDEAEAAVTKAAKKVGFEACGDAEAIGENTTSTEGGGDSTASSSGDTAITPPATTPTDTVTPAPTTPPVDTGTEGGVGTAPATPPADSGGTDSSSGGVSP